MKLLLDMNLPRSLGNLLEAAGQSCRHAGNIGLSRASDSAILRVAREAGEVVVTHDLDFGQLLAFTGDSHPSVIIFRLRTTQVQRLADRFITALPEVEAALQDGALVILEEAGLRVRRLPIGVNG